MKWLLVATLVAIASVAGKKCKSKCKAELNKCELIHGEDMSFTVRDNCVEAEAADAEDGVCQKCLDEKSEGSETEQAAGIYDNQFSCLTKCKWVAIHCTQAGIHAGDLLGLMDCVMKTYKTEVNKKKSPQCEDCILTGECKGYCDDKKGEPCTDDEIADIFDECRVWKDDQDVCGTFNRKTCKSIPLCQLCNGDCLRTKNLEDGKCPAAPAPVEGPTPPPVDGPAGVDLFVSKDDYFKYCKKTYKDDKEGCGKCGGNYQNSKKSCKVRPQKAACKNIGLEEVCEKCGCKVSYNDKEKTDFKRCVNPSEESKSIFDD